MAAFFCFYVEIFGKKLYNEKRNLQRKNDMNKSDFIFFWHEYDENGCFSQWFQREFVVDDIVYLNCEQYMMAQKALLFNDRVNYNKIMRAASPVECKKYGRLVEGFDETIWQSKSEEIIYNGNYAKFLQNKDLKEKLLATGDKILAEASPYDKIYGIGMDDKNPDCVTPSKWKGKNILGNILMKVRENLISE